MDRFHFGNLAVCVSYGVRNRFGAYFPLVLVARERLLGDSSSDILPSFDSGLGCFGEAAAGCSVPWLSAWPGAVACEGYRRGSCFNNSMAYGDLYYQTGIKRKIGN